MPRRCLRIWVSEVRRVRVAIDVMTGRPVGGPGRCTRRLGRLTLGDTSSSRGRGVRFGDGVEWAGGPADILRGGAAGGFDDGSRGGGRTG